MRAVKLHAMLIIPHSPLNHRIVKIIVIKISLNSFNLQV